MKSKQMSKRRSLLVIALAAVIGFSFAALSLTGCDNGYGGGGSGGGGGGSGTTYKGYDADGNAYELTIKAAPKSTTGGTGGTGNRDSRLVNGANDAWVDGMGSYSDGYIFKADGTCHQIDNYTGDTSGWTIFSTGSWSTSGNNLTISGLSYNIYNGTYSYTVNGNTLTLDGGTLTKQTVSVPGRSAGSPAPAGIPEDKAAISKTKRAAADRAGYVAQDGDTYTLKWKDKTSEGTVTGSGTLTLTPNGGSASFTVTTTDSKGITAISGNITWKDGTVTNATMTLTTTAPPKAWTTPSTSGKLTVNSLSAHNGSYALAMAYKNSDKDFCLEAFQDGSGDAQGNFTLNFTEIKNGTAVLNVWKVDTKKDEFVSYGGSDSGLEVIICVFGAQESMTGTMQGEGIVIDYTKLMQSAMTGNVDVCQLTNQKFSGGKLTVTFKGMLDGLYPGLYD